MSLFLFARSRPRGWRRRALPRPPRPQRDLISATGGQGPSVTNPPSRSSRVPSDLVACRGLTRYELRIAAAIAQHFDGFSPSSVSAHERFKGAVCRRPSLSSRMTSGAGLIARMSRCRCSSWHSRSSRRLDATRGRPGEPERLQVQFLDESCDHPHRVVGESGRAWATADLT